MPFDGALPKMQSVKTSECSEWEKECKPYLHGCQPLNNRVLSPELCNNETENLAEHIVVAVPGKR